ETTGAVVADQLLVVAQNSSALTTATNNVTTVAATIAGAGQSFSYRDANSVDIGTVGAVNGITTNAGNITVTALDAGNVTLSRNADTTNGTGVLTAGTVVRLDASTGGAVTETGGAGVADRLRVVAQNSSALTTATNNVTTVAATITGAGQRFSYTDSNTADLPPLAPVFRSTTIAGSITVTALEAGNVTLSQNASTGGAAGTVTLDASTGGAVMGAGVI